MSITTSPEDTVDSVPAADSTVDDLAAREEELTMVIQKIRSGNAETIAYYASDAFVELEAGDPVSSMYERSPQILIGRAEAALNQLRLERRKREQASHAEQNETPDTPAMETEEVHE